MSRRHREVTDLEWRMERANAERVHCPRCHAELGEHCVNTFGDELRAPAHYQRISLANQEAS